MANPVVINDGLHVTGVTSAEEARIVQAGGWAKSGTAGTIVARTGIVWAGSSTLLVGTATVGPPMTVLVKACHFVGAKAASEGVYLGALPADTLVDIAAAPGSNSRIDVVYVMQQDQLATTSPDANTRGVLAVATGTAAASPTAPSIPVGAVEVGQLRVFAGATKTTDGTVTITTTARWTAPLGSPIPVRNSTERDALTAYDGLRVWRLDTHGMESYNGTTWLAATVKRLYAQSQATGSIGNLAAIDSFVLPALPVASRVSLAAIGMIGFAATDNQGFGLNITASTGSMVDVQGNQRINCALNANWYAYSWSAYLDLSASTAATITTTFSAAGANGYWKGLVRAEVYLAGEY